MSAAFEGDGLQFVAGPQPATLRIADADVPGGRLINAGEFDAAVHVLFEGEVAAAPRKKKGAEA